MEISSLTSKKGWDIHMNKEKKMTVLKFSYFATYVPKECPKGKS